MWGIELLGPEENTSLTLAFLAWSDHWWGRRSIAANSSSSRTDSVLRKMSFCSTRPRSWANTEHAGVVVVD